MKIEDVALTVSGVIATMALAYLFYRRQQGSAAAAQPSQDITDYATQGLYDSSVAYQYSSQLPGVTVPAVSSSSTSQASNVDTSASTAAIGSEPSTDIDSIFSQILADFHDAVSASGGNRSENNQGSVDFSDLSIPILDVQPVVSTSGIPVTASDAAQQAENMLPAPSAPAPVASPIPAPDASYSVTGGLLDTQTAATPPPSIQPPATTSGPSMPVHNMHVMGNVMALDI